MLERGQESPSLGSELLADFETLPGQCSELSFLQFRVLMCSPSPGQLVGGECALGHK